MPAAWYGVAEVTIDKYFRDLEDLTMHEQKLLALIQSRGRVFFNQSGLQMNWKVRWRRAIPRGYQDMDSLTYPRRSRDRTARLGWRAYVMAECLSEFDTLQNSGEEAIVSLLEGKVETMGSEMEQFFGEQVYVDGNLPENALGLHGFDSFTAVSGNSSNQPIAFPSDNYAGINTALQAYGGSWETSGGVTTWPSGRGSPEYHFFSPLIVNYTSNNASPAGWTPATKTWAYTGMEATRYGIVKSRISKSKSGQIDVVFMENEMFRLWCELVAQKERLVVNQGQGTGGRGKTLTALGYGDAFWFEGAEITWEFGIPTACAYGFNLDNIELHSMKSKLFNPKGPYDNNVNKTICFDVDFFGNLKFRSPRNFVKWINNGA